MKITRNGQEYDLTFSELMAAHDEYMLDCMIADVKESFAQDSDYKDIELSDEQIRDIAENAIHNLSKNENYGEAYRDSVHCTLKDCVNELLNNVIIKRTIKINFKNLVSEMENKNVKLCFVRSNLHNWGLSLEDYAGNLYRIEPYYDQSYLSKLIERGEIVKFTKVDASVSNNIGEWEKESLDVAGVKNFIETVMNQSSLDDIIDSCEDMSKNSSSNKKENYIEIEK